MAQAKRKKKFIDVSIPLIGKTTQMQAFETKELDGRFAKYDLTRIMRGKNIVLSLKVKADETKAVAHPREIKVLNSYIRRMVRKGTNYIEDSFSTECKDAIIRIKPFLITRRKVSRAVRRALRNKAKSELIKYVKNKTADTLFDETLKNIIQKPLSLKLKKIYPLSLCEIRVLKIEAPLGVPQSTELGGKKELTSAEVKTEKVVEKKTSEKVEEEKIVEEKTRQ